MKITRGRIDASERIDLRGYHVLPGLIDAHVHFRDPGLEYKEDFRTGSMAAAHGGFSTVIDMPNTLPPTDTASEFKRKIEIGERKSIVDFGLHAGYSDPSEIGKILVYGPASFKVFMESTGVMELDLLFQRLREIGSSVPVTVHCEHRELIEHSLKDLQRSNDPFTYSLARPPLAEEVSVSEVLAVSHHHQHPLHVCHLSTRRALELIEPFRGHVTCEVTPHHLLLNSKYLKRFGTLAKTNPPLRPAVEGLSPSLLDRIDIIGTDHAPHTIPEKEEGVWDSPPGIPNLEVALKLLLTMVAEKRIWLSTIRRMLAEGPARIFGLRSKGFIVEGMDADFTVIDMRREGVIRGDEFYSRAHYTPFEGFRYRGEAVMTLVGGEVVMDDGEVFKRSGKYIKSVYIEKDEKRI